MIIDMSLPESSATLTPTATPTCEVGSETRSPKGQSCPGKASGPASASMARRAVPTALAAVALAAATSASGALWSGLGSDALWSNSTNWNEGVLPNSFESAEFSSSGSYSVDVDTSAQASLLNINSATPYSFNNAGGSLTLASGDIDVLSGSHTIRCGVSMTTPGLWSIPSGAQLDVSGSVSGSQSLTKAGDGTLILTGANSYNGGTKISGGTLAITNDSNLGSGPLAFGGNATLNILGTHSSSRSISLTNFQNLINVDGGKTFTLGGVIAGSTGTFGKSGTGTLVLTASNTFSAAINLQSGTLRISNDANLGNPANVIYFLGGGTLEVANSLTLNHAVNFAGGTISTPSETTLTIATMLMGSGFIAKTGAGTLELTGGSSIGVNVSRFGVNAGTLRVNSAMDTLPIVVGGNAVLAGSGSTAGNVTVQASGVIAPGNSTGTFTISGNLTNAGIYHCEVSSTNADKLVVATNLDLTGSTLAIDVLGGLATNHYVIASYGTLTGTFAAVSNLPTGLILDYAYFNGVSSNNIALVPPPGSDACTSAPVVGEGTFSGNTTTASNDGTSSCGDSATSPDVWFAYQASSNGVANARTGPGLGTDFDTAIAVFDGCGGNEIIANDDAYSGDASGISEVSWVVTVGQMYWIRVAGFGGDTGNYTLEVRVDPQPFNDKCANALAVADGSYAGTTVGTTAEGILDCQYPETHDVWFVYTNPDECAKDVTFSTCNGTTDFDTVLRLYNACGGSLLGLNDDGCPGPNTGASTLTRTVQPFASVRIRLNGYGSVVGQYQLDVTSVYSPLTFCAATLLHWPLEEGSGTNTTEAVSGAANVAHLVNDVIWTNGIAFDSSHAVAISNGGTGWIDAGTLTTNGTYVAGMSPAYRSTGNQWSITAWVNLPDPQATVGRRELIGSATGVNNWWNFGVQDWAGTQEALTFDFNTVPVRATIGVPLGKPVFVAVIANNAGLGAVTNRHRFAMWDGASWSVEDGTAFATLGLAVNIGTWREGVDKFDGSIDDVRIFDRALTQTELEFVAMIPPSLAIVPAGAGSNNISWTPDLPGYVLQETPGLSPAAWTNSPSGATNPIVVPTAEATKFYRLFKP